MLNPLDDGVPRDLVVVSPRCWVEVCLLFKLEDSLLQTQLLLSSLSLMRFDLVLDLFLDKSVDSQVGLAELLELVLVLRLQLLKTLPHFPVVDIQFAYVMAKTNDALAVNHLLLLNCPEHLVDVLVGDLFACHSLALC